MSSLFPSLLSLSANNPSLPSTPIFPTTTNNKLFLGVWWARDTDKRRFSGIIPRCSAISKPRSQGYEVLQDGPPVIKWHEFVEDDIEPLQPEHDQIIESSKEIKEYVEAIKAMLESMDDGEISISAYDTAWVALVKNQSGTPQFPSSLQWIANNQLADGSWGDSDIFLAHDRIINTLACVVALKYWNIHPKKCAKGMLFLKENMHKLEDENAEHMPIGFEVAFPSLIEIARKLDIEIPNDDSDILREIYSKRNLKLSRIPKDILHTVPTTLLHSLEGMAGLNWEKLLGLQSLDGSFLFSPSSTAFALMETKDGNCLNYLNQAVDRFNGGVPNVYPVDLFEHLWAVDRLQRLGISRYFVPEIQQCISYVKRYWTDNGICWARNSQVSDIDDTAMGFRLLRLHGHEVSAGVFKSFQKDGEFFCFNGQSTQAVTGIFNLYRASQLLFPGEEVLEEAKQYSLDFLRKKQAADQLVDKWIITKDLPGEVRYALDVPWYASLPRLETRFYIEQYGGEHDVWIGKTLYRMPYVNNNLYVELAKIDYNNCQALHRCEWDSIQLWHSKCKLGEFGVSRRTPLLAYFLAVASVYEPERSRERLAWAKTTTLVETIATYFEAGNASRNQRRAFVLEFKNTSKTPEYVNGWRSLRPNKIGQGGLIQTLLGTLNQLSLNVLVGHGRDIRHPLRSAWEKWLVRWEEEGDRYDGVAELIVQIMYLVAGRRVPEDVLSHPHYHDLSILTNKICHRLGNRHIKEQGHYNGNHNGNIGGKTIHEIESAMQELARMVLKNSQDGIDKELKNTYLYVAKSFYYAAYCDWGTIDYHIGKVLFEKVN